MGSAAGGVERHVREVSGLLAQAGCQVVVAAPAGADVVADDAVTHVVMNLADRPQVSDVAVLRTVRRLARGADVVHAHGLRAGAVAVLAARSVRRRSRPGVVVTLHNLPVGSPMVRVVSSVLERTVARGAGICLGVSSDLVERVRLRGARHASRALVPAPPRPTPARTPAQVRADLGVGDDALLVLTVARLAPQKGLHLLVEAAAMLGDPCDGDPPHCDPPHSDASDSDASHSDPVPPARCSHLPDDDRPVSWVVAGDGPLRDELTAQIIATGAPVTLLGRRDDIADLMTACDVLCSTSVWEGQPLVVQEALQLGVPVVATDVGGTREVTGDAAVLVPYGDPRQLATALARLLACDSDRQVRAQASATQAARLPTASDVLAQLTATYNTLLAPP